MQQSRQERVANNGLFLSGFEILRLQVLSCDRNRESDIKEYRRLWRRRVTIENCLKLEAEAEVVR